MQCKWLHMQDKICSIKLKTKSLLNEAITKCNWTQQIMLMMETRRM